MSAFYLAYRYLAFHRVRTAILVLTIAIIAFLPVALRLLVDASAERLAARADDDAMVLGQPGSGVDLVMGSLYFTTGDIERITMADLDAVDDTRLAWTIPLLVRHRAGGFPIVGTTLDYFDHRNLTVREGRELRLLGECVLGARAAAALDLAAGDRLMSEPQGTFDLAGAYPLRMTVVGVLAPTDTPDDDAVFVDVATTWILDGHGHGHQDLENQATSGAVTLRRDGQRVIANAAIVEYQEVTADNLESFHFHGDAGALTVTSALVVPEDDRARTILRGRYASGEAELQLVRPDEVVDELMTRIFRLEAIATAMLAVAGAATLLALILVFTLSLRLREDELVTNRRMGAARFTTARLLAAELVLILVASAVITATLTGIAVAQSDAFLALMLR